MNEIRTLQTRKELSTSCFKAYDIRGRVPETLDAEIAYRIGRSLVTELKAKTMVIGRDMRLESPMLADALGRGITEAGADVIDIGLCGTEEVYFATSHENADGGVMVTASHNPKGCNGMKLVREGSRPISGDTGLQVIRIRVESGNLGMPWHKSGTIRPKTDKSAYIQHLLSYVDINALKPFSILADPGNGVAGPVIEALAAHLPFQWSFINCEPDGNFPNGVPNPLLPESREHTRAALLANHCDLALAWDGDFDRCFFFDANGRFIEGYYIVGLLAEVMLKKYPGAKIIHDPRLTWNTRTQVKQAGGKSIQSKTGHAFIKERMRQEDAVYGGEMSAHHYFRDFAYCDSGMIPWLLVTALMSETGRTLAELVDERIVAYPCSGEINYRVGHIPTVIEHVRNHFAHQNPHVDETDGLSLEFEQWRFNLRGSNTEPLLRLNVETRGDTGLLSQTIAVFEKLITEDVR
jgi:phosphomannomutase / phosphoglucomutase